VGPFYCPGDRKAYLDLDFLGELQERLGAEGDFAAAYIIAHEVGHHVQKLLGTSDRVSADGKDRGPKSNAVRLELQADCYAGVWGAHASRRGLLEGGDLEEALGAAGAIGDDTLQRRAKGRVSPESFSHGTSEQRVRWFKKGMESGDPRACDTFAVASP
jgi:predicted metalloprotease